MSCLCSILIPARGGIERLMRTLSSINATATLDYEILVRLDNDDAINISAMDEIKEAGKAVTFVGPRFGYANLSRYYNELVKHAKGQWVWIAGDDMIVHGPWDMELSKISPEWIVQPEISRLGHSTYRLAVRQAFPIVPMNSWRKFGAKKVPENADVTLHDGLSSRGWGTVFMAGVTIWHDQPRGGRQQT